LWYYHFFYAEPSSSGGSSVETDTDFALSLIHNRMSHGKID